MHEMSIAQNMIAIIEDEMKKHNACGLKSIRVNVGSLSSIMPEALSYCFEIMIKDTHMEGARLFIDVIPLIGSCSSCNNKFEIKDYTFSCPVCQSIEIDIISGTDLSVVEMEVY